MSLSDLGFTPEELAAAGATSAITSPEDFPPLPPEPVQEAAFETKEVVELARKSLNFLAALVMPTIFKAMFPAVFLAVWDLLLSSVHKTRDFTQLALGLPRGFGKTTLIKLFIFFCVVFTQKKFIIIISSTATLAENILSDVVDMLEEPNVKKVFGDWKLGIEKDTQAIKKFGFRGRNITLAALGAGTSLRGLNIKNERPDVMIFEDIQTRECADSEVQSAALEQWMIGTAMKAKSPAGCLFIFVANMYPTKYSILRKLKSNPLWIKFIVGGILANGESLWEELQPRSQLLAEFESDLAMGHPEIFMAEVLNDESAAEGTALDLSKLPAYPFEPGEISSGNFIIIDPATDKVDADAVSIGLFNIYDSRPVLTKLIEGRLSPGDTIKAALQLALENNCYLIVIESNAYQYTLKYWFEFICVQLGIEGIEAVDIYSGSYSKNSRILTMFKALLAGEIYMHPETKTAVYNQISHFNPLKRDNTDGILDLLTYAPRVVELYGAEIVSRSPITVMEAAVPELVEFNTTF